MSGHWHPPRLGAHDPRHAAADAPADAIVMLGCWRDRHRVVVHKEAMLPARCVRTNEPTANRVRRTFQYCPMVILFCLLAGVPGIVVYVVLSILLTKTATLYVPLSPGEAERWRGRRMIARVLFAAALTIGAAGIALFVFADQPFSAIGMVAFLVGAVLLIAAMVYALVAVPFCRAARVTDSFVWLRGVHPEYVAALPPWPGEGAALAGLGPAAVYDAIPLPMTAPSIPLPAIVLSPAGPAAGAPVWAAAEPVPVGALPEMGVWRDGDLLVLHYQSLLPERCVASNEPAAGHVQRTVAGGVVVRVPVGPSWLRRRQLTRIVGWAVLIMGLAGVVLGLYAGVSDWGGKHDYAMYVLFVLGAAALAAGLAMALSSPHPLLVRHMAGPYIWMKGAHHGYLAMLPPLPRGPG